MNPPGKLTAGMLLPVVGLCLLAAAAVPAPPGPERTLFKDIPASEPARKVIQTVLGSRFYSLRDRFSPEEWSAGGYGAAWERARDYFPGKTYLVRPGTYFMTHGYDAGGRLFMEVHQSPYLALCVENWKTFSAAAIIEEYGRMLSEVNGIEAGGFREKTGRLESYFRDKKANGELLRALGDVLYGRLLGALREEDYHMLAGGLMHEGLHAGLDGRQAARFQADSKAGTEPVQWDELQAFMGEIGYHARFSGWAAADIGATWARISALVKDLEAFRKTAKLPTGSAKDRFDRIRAQAWTQIAFVRLRAREIWQSARRIADLTRGFRQDYVHGDAPPDLSAMLAKLESGTAEFVDGTDQAIRSTELELRSLEAVLDTWGVWAAGRRPFPPPVTDSQWIVRQAKDIRWPAANAEAATALMRRASKEIEKVRMTS